MKSKIFEEKKMKSIYEENFVFRFSKKNFRRNLSYDEYITHAKLFDHRSRGSGDTRGDRQTQDEDLLYRSTSQFACRVSLFQSIIIAMHRKNS